MRASELSRAVSGVLVMLAVVMSGCTSTAQGALLVEDGQPRAAIVLPAEPDALEQQAADELVAHIEKISGAALPVLTGEAAPEGQTPIRLGGAADAALEDAVREQGDNPSAFALVATDADIAIRGLSPEGTLFGAYELLEQLGVRWYHPGELGTVIPEAQTLALETQRTVQVPSMDYRRLQHITGGDWPQRVRLGGEARSTGAHGIPPFKGGARGKRHFEENPEYFALVNGERIMRQVCVSNPEVVKLTTEAVRQQLENNPDLKYVGMGPNDGGGYCECENCKALDQGVYDPLRDAESMTDRYIWFFNQVLENLEDEHPDLHIVWYVYAAHMMPPEIEPNERIVGVFAPITLDRIRGMDNPMSPDRHILRWLIDAWAETNPNEMYFRGYYNNLACPQFPLSQVDRIRTETPAFYEKGIRAMRVEAIRPAWSAHTPSLYLAARLMWDVNTDVDALLDEFYDKFYGPASEPMGGYHEALDAAFRDTPYFTGGSYPYLVIFDDERRSSFRQLLDRAAQSAQETDKEIYAERIASVRMAWDRLELFLDMIEARNAHDFAAAHEKMQQFYALSDEMVNYVLEGDGGRGTHRLLEGGERSDNRGSYFNRFWSPAVKSGHQRA
ncbi:MAG: DUF4838 domain-containing protein, partial [Phycisphaeraceae bacterium]